MIFNLYLHMETKDLGEQVIHPGGGRVGIFTDVEKGHNKKWCYPPDQSLFFMCMDPGDRPAGLARSYQEGREGSGCFWERPEVTCH